MASTHAPATSLDAERPPAWPAPPPARAGCGPITSVTTTKLAFAPRQQPQPVDTRRRPGATPPMSQHLALDGDDGEAQQVIGGDAVFQAVRAAGVHADVAADHARELRWTGRARRRSPGLLHRLGDGDVGDARLHGGAAVGVVDVQDAGSSASSRAPRQSASGMRAAGQAGAGAARHHAHAACGGRKLQHGGHLLGGLRQQPRQAGFAYTRTGRRSRTACRRSGSADDAAGGQQGHAGQRQFRRG